MWLVLLFLSAVLQPVAAQGVATRTSSACPWQPTDPEFSDCDAPEPFVPSAYFLSVRESDIIER